MESSLEETLRDILLVHFGKIITNVERLVGYEDTNFLLTVNDSNSDIMKFGHVESHCKKLVLKLTAASHRRLGM